MSASPSQNSFPSIHKQTVETLMEETIQYSFSTLLKTSTPAVVPLTQILTPTPTAQLVVTKLLHADETGVMSRLHAKQEPNSVSMILLFTAV